METPDERIRRVLSEEVAIAPYDPDWPESFRREREHLLSCLPSDLVRRVEHFGSTAVPGLSAKPIVDILVEVSDLEATRARIAPVLESQGYDYFWRPTHGEDGPPFYAWFIRRDRRTGARTHHIHMVERGFAEHWDRLLFRDYLIEHPEVAREYERLKLRLASVSSQDRRAYTRGKTEFVVEVTETAKRYYDEARRRSEAHPSPERGAIMATNTIRLHRVLRATPERVYRAFLDPDAMVKWLPPNGFTGKVHQMDARVGGAHRMSFTNFTTGKAHSFGGKYLELLPSERIRYTDAFDDPSLPGEMRTTVDLKKVSCGTELSIVQEGVPDVIPPDACYLGWQESLMLLAKLVEAEIPD